MRNALECLYSLFANGDNPKGQSSQYISLKPVTEYSSFPVLDVKYNSKFPNQLQLVMNSHTGNLQKNINEILDGLNRALWSDRRDLLFVEQRASRAEGRKMNFDTVQTINQIPKYQLDSKANNLIVVTGGRLECTVRYLLKNDFCDGSVLPPELKALVPEDLQHKIPREFETLGR